MPGASDGRPGAAAAPPIEASNARIMASCSGGIPPEKSSGGPGELWYKRLVRREAGEGDGDGRGMLIVGSSPSSSAAAGEDLIGDGVGSSYSDAAASPLALDVSLERRFPLALRMASRRAAALCFAADSDILFVSEGAYRGFVVSRRGNSSVWSQIFSEGRHAKTWLTYKAG